MFAACKVPVDVLVREMKRVYAACDASVVLTSVRLLAWFNCFNCHELSSTRSVFSESSNIILTRIIGDLFEKRKQYPFVNQQE